MNVLFVCTGNTCRSPMAEKILQKKAAEKNIDIQVKSAGVATFYGQPASTHARVVMQEYGMPDQHITQNVTEELLNWADIILTMTEGHKDYLFKEIPYLANRIHTLLEYTHNREEDQVERETQRGYDVEDPFGGNLEQYRRTAKEIEEAIDRLLKNI